MLLQGLTLWCSERREVVLFAFAVIRGPVFLGKTAESTEPADGGSVAGHPFLLYAFAHIAIVILGRKSNLLSRRVSVPEASVVPWSQLPWCRLEVVSNT